MNVGHETFLFLQLRSGSVRAVRFKEAKPSCDGFESQVNGEPSLQTQYLSDNGISVKTDWCSRRRIPMCRGKLRPPYHCHSPFTDYFVAQPSAELRLFFPRLLNITNYFPFIHAYTTFT